MNLRKAFYLLLAVFAMTSKSNAQPVANTMRAPAYPLVNSDPYFGAWSMSDHLYDEPVKHWTGKEFPLIGAIRVDGKVYRFMGTEEIPLIPIVHTAERGAWTGRYTFDKPGDGWEKPNFVDSKWKTGLAAFGTPEETAVQTLWETDYIWVRREVEIKENLDGKAIYLEYSHDDDIAIYINGFEVVKTGHVWLKNVRLKITGKAAKSLKPGKNIIAAHCRNRTGGALVDFGLSYEAPIQRMLETTAVQTSVDVQATQTHYTFTCGQVDLKVTFLTPLLMNNLDLVSRPVSYISYQVQANDGKEHQVEMYLEASPLWALNTAAQASETESFEKDNLIYLKAGSQAQKMLVRGGDDWRIDWGYVYLCAGKENTTYSTGDSYVMRADFGNNGALKNKSTSFDGHDKMALVQNLGKVSASKAGRFMIAYDDIYSIQYFGDNLRPYWNRKGDKNMVDLLKQADTEFGQLEKDCKQFDIELMNKAIAAGGQRYAELCALAYRQAISAHKLVEAPNGDILFLSKENNSNGSIGTVDVTYPSAPLFLLYNTELTKGLLNHIFYFSESGRWTKPFAAHDIGTYPLGNGQTYGGDMPVEESGNMLILTAAIAVKEGNAKYAEKHWETLTVWTDYLVEKGLDPENQLCTDDFAGHFAHNTNLSVKAILGIASYGHLATMLGKKEVGEKYTATARKMAAEWEKMANDGAHYRLTFDQPGTWSQKYNLVWEKLLKLNIFPKVVAEKEIPFYLTKQNIYGLPLDSRKSYTKSDWVIWSATLANDKATFEKFIDPLHKFYSETTDRVPLSDWFDTKTKRRENFKARSVVGGFFIKVLEKEL